MGVKGERRRKEHATMELKEERGRVIQGREREKEREKKKYRTLSIEGDIFSKLNYNCDWW